MTISGGRKPSRQIEMRTAVHTAARHTGSIND